jgi:hypothetical protein
LVGYGAIIDSLKLEVPMPEQLSLISDTHKKYREEEWQIFTPRYKRLCENSKSINKYAEN